MTHEERVHHHMYETCEGIAEHAERIVALEELVAGLMRCPVDERDCLACPMATVDHSGEWPDATCSLAERAKELGIEVEA